jgi:hypothetical protein
MLAEKDYLFRVPQTKVKAGVITKQSCAPGIEHKYGDAFPFRKQYQYPVTGCDCYKSSLKLSTDPMKPNQAKIQRS